MQKIFLSLLMTFLILACEKTECCVVIDTFADISVVEKNTSKDLLNPGADNHFDIKAVKLAFSVNPDQKTSIDAIQTSKPLFFKKGDKYYLRIFPTTHEPLHEKHTVTIYWNDTNTDKVTFLLKTSGTTTITEKILVNDELKWELANGYREITIQK